MSRLQIGMRKGAESFLKTPATLDNRQYLQSVIGIEAERISEKDVCDLITITLANWLEQRPRAKPEQQFIRREEFSASRRFLPDVAYAAFKAAYGIR